MSINNTYRNCDNNNCYELINNSYDYKLKKNINIKSDKNKFQ